MKQKTVTNNNNKKSRAYAMCFVMLSYNLCAMSYEYIDFFFVFTGNRAMFWTAADKRYPQRMSPAMIRDGDSFMENFKNIRKRCNQHIFRAFFGGYDSFKETCERSLICLNRMCLHYIFYVCF